MHSRRRSGSDLCRRQQRLCHRNGMFYQNAQCLFLRCRVHRHRYVALSYTPLYIEVHCITRFMNSYMYILTASNLHHLIYIISGRRGGAGAAREVRVAGWGVAREAAAVGRFLRCGGSGGSSTVTAGGPFTVASTEASTEACTESSTEAFETSTAALPAWRVRPLWVGNGAVGGRTSNDGDGERRQKQCRFASFRRSNAEVAKGH